MSVGYDMQIVGLEQQLERLKGFERIADARFRPAMNKSVIAVARAVTELAPTGISGRFKGSIGSEIKREGPMSIIGRIGSTLTDEVYPAVVEFGRKPGKMPLIEANGQLNPPDELIRWVRVKGVTGRYSIKNKRRLGSKRTQEDEDRSAAWMIARSIARRGIKGKYPFRRGWEKTRGQVSENFEQAIKQITEDLSNGRK